MVQCGTFYFLPLFVLWLNLGHALAQERQLLYPKSLSGQLQDIAGMIRNPKSQKIPYDQLTWKTDYFVRITARRHILTENNDLQDNAILGTKPFVFVTTPESVYSRSLLEIYEDIGYGATDIIRWQRNEDMVAIVFRYLEENPISEVRDGQLPNDWDKKVYIPTWDNVFALFSRLANSATTEPTKQEEIPYEKTFFKSDAERAFVWGFPGEGKQRIKTTGYAGLKAIGGADWEYRKLLENKLSIFEHFQGNGRTHNEVLNQPEAGLIEFVGPNQKIKALPKVAIIHLGQLTIEDTYSAGSTPSLTAR
jgi:hypothetical protein